MVTGVRTPGDRGASISVQLERHLSSFHLEAFVLPLFFPAWISLPPNTYCVKPKGLWDRAESEKTAILSPAPSLSRCGILSKLTGIWFSPHKMRRLAQASKGPLTSPTVLSSHLTPSFCSLKLIVNIFCAFLLRASTRHF